MAQTIHSPKVRANPVLSLHMATASKTTIIGSALVGLLLLGGCASTPVPPTAELQAAEQAISSAERARVADYASVELSEARDKLSAARIAVKEEQMTKAQRLALQARADAELASARAEVARAKVVNEQMQKGTDTLKQEMQRNTGDQ